MKVKHARLMDWNNVHIARLDLSDLKNTELYDVTNKKVMDSKRYAEFLVEVIGTGSIITEEEYNNIRNNW